jgi:hypothetical protein
MAGIRPAIQIYFALLAALVRGVNYFRRWRRLFLPVKVSKESPTTWRHPVVVVGRSVAVERISAGAPAGAEAPAEMPEVSRRSHHPIRP